MKKQKQLKKITFGVVLFVAFFGVASFSRLSSVRAAVTDAVGWLWGGSEVVGNETGLGWVSLNSSDAGAGGVPYLVTIPLSGAVTGYAWSENTGWIDFDPQNHCTTGTPAAGQYKALSCTVPTKPDGTSYNIGSGGVFRTSNTSMSGWARFVSIARESAVGNSGDWDGWIALGIGNNYDVVIDAATGQMSGYGWSELGAIEFRGHAVVIPIVTITTESALVNVRNLILPQQRTISWTSTSATSCRLVSTPSHAWDQNPIVPDSGTVTAGSKNIDITLGMEETFTITCSGPGDDSDPKSMLITTACYPLECNNQKCEDNTSSSNRRIGATAVSECTPNDLCTYDTDCQQKTTSLNGWKEVAPR
jgi:hypothetical protein